MCLDYKLLMSALHEHGVKYLVVGGRAVRHYCPERDVDDLNLMINSTEENVKKVEFALSDLEKYGFYLVGIGEKRINLNLLAKPCVYFPLKSRIWATKTINADILTSPKEFDFNSAFHNSINGELNGICVNFVSRSDQIRLSEIAYRSKEKECRRMEIAGEQNNPEYERYQDDIEKCHRDIELLRKSDPLPVN